MRRHSILFSAEAPRFPSNLKSLSITLHFMDFPGLLGLPNQNSFSEGCQTPEPGHVTPLGPSEEGIVFLGRSDNGSHAARPGKRDFQKQEVPGPMCHKLQGKRRLGISSSDINL